jgi:hypothetical protein
MRKKRFGTNELPLKRTSQYTLIKRESISNGKKIYVLCCFFLFSVQFQWKWGWGKCGNYAEKMVGNSGVVVQKQIKWQ